MGKEKKIFLIIAILCLAIILVFLIKLNTTGFSAYTIEVPEIAITYNNIEEVLSKHNLIKNLPIKTTILLRFYNFNTGERQWEKSYILEKGKVKEGFIENPDATLIINSKYLNGLTTANFCSVFANAKKNGDATAETNLSKIRFLWKFKSFLKYKGCLGF